MVADNKNPITDATMVLQLTQHTGKIDPLTKKTIKFKKRAPELRTLIITKEYFRDVIEDINNENRAIGTEVEQQVNSATIINNAEQKVHNEIREKMSGPFEALACAAVAKSDMLDQHTATILALTTTVTELTASNKKLVEQLALALATCVKPPPGMSVIPPPILSPTTTGHALNTAGIACPTTLNPQVKRWYFVTKQDCKMCGKSATYLPEKCLELP